MGAMPFSPGDLVHVASLGTGTVREVRNHDRYLVALKGRAVEVKGDQLTAQAAPRVVILLASSRESLRSFRLFPTPLGMFRKRPWTSAGTRSRTSSMWRSVERRRTPQLMS